jgi:hypothetical protein
MTLHQSFHAFCLSNHLQAALLKAAAQFTLLSTVDNPLVTALLQRSLVGRVLGSGERRCSDSGVSIARLGLSGEQAAAAAGAGENRPAALTVVCPQLHNTVQWVLEGARKACKICMSRQAMACTHANGAPHYGFNSVRSTLIRALRVHYLAKTGLVSASGQPAPSDLFLTLLRDRIDGLHDLVSQGCLQHALAAVNMTRTLPPESLGQLHSALLAIAVRELDVVLAAAHEKAGSASGSLSALHLQQQVHNLMSWYLRGGAGQAVIERCPPAGTQAALALKPPSSTFALKPPSSSSPRLSTQMLSSQVPSTTGIALPSAHLSSSSAPSSACTSKQIEECSRLYTAALVEFLREVAVSCKT